MPEITLQQLAWSDTPYPLGRNIVHDSRSLAFMVEAPKRVTPVSRTWTRYTPILDQGNLGSCTGNAITGLCGTAPFYGSLYALRKAGLLLDESLAVALYERATVIDPFSGSYPPDDTGSDGLSVTKAAIERGLLSKTYLHINSLAAAYTAIAKSPFIVGSYWYDDMFNPDSSGVVKIGGAVAGGHEYECLGYSTSSKRWKFANSWGPGWGRSGYFYMSNDTLAQLLSEQGDATVPNKLAA